MTKHQIDEPEDNFFFAGSDGKLRKPLSVSDNERERRNFERVRLTSRFTSYLPTWLSFGTWTLDEACRLLAGIPIKPIAASIDIDDKSHLENVATYKHLVMIASTYPELTSGGKPNEWMAWAKSIGAGMHLFAVAGTPATTKAQSPIKDEWTNKARNFAQTYIDEWRKAGFSPTKQDAALYVEGVFSTDGIYGDRGQVLDAAYIERHSLTGITGNKPGSKSKKPKVPDGQRGKLPENK